MKQFFRRYWLRFLRHLVGVNLGAGTMMRHWRGHYRYLDRYGSLWDLEETWEQDRPFRMYKVVE